MQTVLKRGSAHNEYKKQCEEFAEQYNINIRVYSIISGTIVQFDEKVHANGDIPVVSEFAAVYDLNSFQRIDLNTSNRGSVSYLIHTGMLGVEHSDIERLEAYSEKASEEIIHILGDARKLLVLGHGENIYIPSRIAASMAKMGLDVSFRTTSRTPIYCDGEIIMDAVKFVSQGDLYHFYNRCEANSYDAVVMIANSEFKYRLCDNIKIFNA